MTDPIDGGAACATSSVIHATCNYCGSQIPIPYAQHVCNSFGVPMQWTEQSLIALIQRQLLAAREMKS